MHVSPTSPRKRGRLVVAAVLMGVVPLVAGVWYYGYNVGAVSITVTDDAIEQFESLNITFTEVSVHATGALTATSWVSLNLQTTTINLKALHDNLTTTIGSDKVPAGKYTQARLDVSSAVGMLTSGKAVTVSVPNGQLLTTNPFELGPGGTVTVLMRIHVVQAGSSFHLEPVLGSVLGS